MTRDEIIGMMQSACDTDKVDAWHNEFWTVTQEELERFAALVAAAEREACARACDEVEEKSWESWDSQADPTDQGSAIGAAHCAAAIRARGQE